MENKWGVISVATNSHSALSTLLQPADFTFPWHNSLLKFEWHIHCSLECNLQKHFLGVSIISIFFVCFTAEDWAQGQALYYTDLFPRLPDFKSGPAITLKKKKNSLLRLHKYAELWRQKCSSQHCLHWDILEDIQAWSPGGKCVGYTYTVLYPTALGRVLGQPAVCVRELGRAI